MKINIKTESFSQNFVELYRIRLNLHLKNSARALIMFGGLSLLFLVIGISTGDKYSMMNTGTKKIYYNLNLFTSIGISIVLVLLYVLRQRRLFKKNFLKAALQIAQKFEGINELRYEFNETEIIIDYGPLYEKINWKLFMKKTYHDRFIFLNFSDKLMDGVAINGNLFSDSDLIAIKEIIDQKVK